jgi:hypothetical protein
MSTDHCWALKEWAVVCAALAAGRQTLILRKGGIAEGRAGFQVEHPVFWLLPTRFHQSPDELAPEAVPLLSELDALTPPAGQLRIDLRAQVVRVDRIQSAAELPHWTARQILSADNVRSRFHYRAPGLFALTLRVFRRETPWLVADLSEYAGCHSWVELVEPPPPAGLVPVLTDAEFRAAARLEPIA